MACAAGSCVNMTLMIKLNCEKIVLNFKLIILTKITQSSISPPNLGPKFMKLSLKNLTHWGLFNNNKCSPQLSKIILLNFFEKNSIIDNSCIVVLNISKPPHCTLTHQGLSNHTKSMMRGTMVWEISMWQTNKQPSFTYRNLVVRLMHVWDVP